MERLILHWDWLPQLCLGYPQRMQVLSPLPGPLPKVTALDV